jgi:hypothetical protein
MWWLSWGCGGSVGDVVAQLGMWWLNWLSPQGSESQTATQQFWFFGLDRGPASLIVPAGSISERELTMALVLYKYLGGKKITNTNVVDRKVLRISLLLMEIYISEWSSLSGCLY